MPNLFYTDTFVLPLPDGHRFPMSKYRLLRERFEAAERADAILRVPDAATDGQLLRAHDAEYLQRVIEGTLTRKEILRTGFPWSPQMVERSRRSSGATIAACRAALQDGFAANLAGGTHHAFRNAGEGFCIFNDAAVAARELQATGDVGEVLVIDCDVHQGNGTAAICRGDASIFTFSIHGARNFPSRKEVSDLDIGLPDGTEDAPYLEQLNTGLEAVFVRFSPDIVIYVSGADPFEHDRLGRMKLTKEGLARRDRLVYEQCRERQLPVAVVMAGGYAENVTDIVDIHFETIRLGLEVMTSNSE
ncbi:histone deacetylase family protein [Stratiformator vulcanicus]|uniref:Histone deacetylase-like amidohydrolase n=1 Tax=Stratiformator vulcanicus TaxID=2527980 RepID=A0A517QX98_9PLAN|nr:histone deacetylase [Stratiformator vulcanicus]QDT36279.1 Histone deacetylase-like amidohydrolase [Stratiformator vulcanicus]